MGTVSAVVRAAAAAGLDWERVGALSEVELEAALYGTPRRALRTPLPDPAWMDGELKKAGVTLRLLHVEYRESHPDGYGYTQFCEHYRRWKRTQRVVMRQVCVFRRSRTLRPEEGERPFRLMPNTSFEQGEHPSERSDAGEVSEVGLVFVLRSGLRHGLLFIGRRRRPRG